MIAANRPVQRARDARLLVVAGDRIVHAPRSRLLDFLRPGDLLVANDAATIPASLQGVHLRSGRTIEVRLAGHLPPVSSAIRFVAVVFGEGDYRTRTEDRPLPPALEPGDCLTLGPSTRAHENADERSLRTGPLVATIEALLDHPRLVSLRFTAPAADVWAGLARHGRPIQYAHLPDALALWDVWTPMASVPVAFEPPSAGFALDWGTIQRLRDRGVSFATVTHAAGVSSTGDPELDRRLPLDEPYEIPEATSAAIRRAKARGGRVVAVGTTVVRALEHAARRRGGVRAGSGVATQRLGRSTCLRVVDAILSGTHEPGSSHYELLRAFIDDRTLARVSASLDAGEYRTHEFGDSILIERDRRRRRIGRPSTVRYWLSNRPSTLPSVSAMRA